MRNTAMVVLVAVFMVSAIAWSQVSTGAINVAVQDSTGAAVTITHTGTGLVRQG